MPAVTKRLAGNITIATTSSYAEAFIGNDWDLTKTFVVFTMSTDSNISYNEAAIVSAKIYINGGNKYVRFERNSTGVYIDVDIDYTVLELTNTAVQTGASSMTSSETSKTATITSVDTAKTFIIATGRRDTTSTELNSAFFTATLTNATTITFERGTAAGNLNIEWQVITITDITSIQVKTGSITSAGSNVTDISITSVDLTKSFVIPSYRTTQTPFQSKHLREAHLTSATNLRFEAYTNIAGGSINYVLTVITMNGLTVNRGYTSMESGNLSATVSIGATIDDTKSLAKLQGYQHSWCEANASTNNTGDTPFRISALSTTQLTATRGRTGVAGYFAWEVLQFADTTSVVILRRRRETFNKYF